MNGEGDLMALAFLPSVPNCMNTAEGSVWIADTVKNRWVRQQLMNVVVLMHILCMKSEWTIMSE